MLRLEFDQGTLLIHNADDEVREGLQRLGCVYDSRVNHLRAQAYRYREILTFLHRSEVEHDNRAGGFDELDLKSREIREPFPYQAEAVAAWDDPSPWGRGLTDGGGQDFCRSDDFRAITPSCLGGDANLGFDAPMVRGPEIRLRPGIGLVGGGHYEVQDLTVTTYDSAYIHMERLGNRFALLVFDECHHLPALPIL